MWQGRNRVAIVGVGYSETGRRLERPLGLLARDSALAALQDAGLDPAEVDGVATHPDMPVVGSTAGGHDGVDVVSVDYLISALGVGESVRWYSQNSLGLIPTAIIDAANAIIAGACEVALVWRAMRMPRGRYNAWTSPVATGPLQFAIPYGALQGAVPFALAYRSYLRSCGAGRESLGRYLVNNRRNAHRNPRAYFRDKELSLDEYLDERMVADPIGIFDCDIPLDGCAAVVLTSADRAKDLRHPPAYLRAYAQSTVPGAHLAQLGDVEHLRQAGTSLATTLWARSGLAPGGIGAAMLYDGFSPFVLWWLESLGFCGKGEAWQYVQDGCTDLGRELPVNTSGGSLGEGRIHGMAHIAEAVLQISGRAGPRQVPDLEHTLAVVGPPVMMSSGLVLSREP